MKSELRDLAKEWRKRASKLRAVRKDPYNEVAAALTDAASELVNVVEQHKFTPGEAEAILALQVYVGEAHPELEHRAHVQALLGALGKLMQ